MDVPSASDMRRVASSCRSAARNPAFDHILRRAANTVKQAAQQRFASVAIEIPAFVHGCPIFKVDAAAEYLARVLAAKGFEVSMCASSTMVVRWGERAAPLVAPAAAAAEDRFSRLSGVL